MKKVTKKGFGGLLCALLLAVELAVLADVAAALLGHPLPRLPWLIGAGLLFLALALLPVSRRGLRDEVITLLLILGLAALLTRGFLLFSAGNGGYAQADRGKSELYAGRRVAVVAPRPGDEIALAGGVMEQLLRYGSELYLVFEEGQEETDAARAAAATLGLGEERVLFLETGSAAALQEVLEQLRPDLVIGAAPEGDDGAALLTEALTQFRERTPEYKPLVLLGLCRGTGYDAPADFYRANVVSTQEPAQSPAGFAWEERVRLPVDGTVLSRSLPTSLSFAQLRQYGAEADAERLINGDRVFWPWAGSPAETELSFVKIMNAQGDFVYDYYIDQRGKESFELYTAGTADQPYSVVTEGEHCSAKISQGRVLEVSCPKGRQCIVTVTSADGRYWDTVVISNPGRFDRSTAQSLEKALRFVWEQAVPATNSWQLGIRGWEALQEKTA